MELKTFYLLFITQMVLSLTPGPAVLGVMSQALSRGTSKSIATIAGIISANLFYFVLSGTGVGALLVASYRVFSVVRWIGAAYLIWLGLSAIFGNHSALSVKAADDADSSALKRWMNGAILQLSNPKALIFFTALLPQFLNPGHNLVLQLLIIAAVNALCDFAALLGYGMLAGRVTHLADQPKFRRVADCSAGAMLITAGVATARLHRN